MSRPGGDITDEDMRGEREVAQELERVSGWKVHYFGKYNPVDFYAEKDGRVIAVLELKRRNITSRQHETIFLSVRKMLALQLAGIGLNVKPLFVVRFIDGLFVLKVNDFIPTQPVIAGRTDRGYSTDQEPIYRVPIRLMNRVSQSGGI